MIHIGVMSAQNHKGCSQKPHISIKLLWRIYPDKIYITAIVEERFLQSSLLYIVDLYWTILEYATASANS
jgi:hypothetical protein